MISSRRISARSTLLVVALLQGIFFLVASASKAPSTTTSNTKIQETPQQDECPSSPVGEAQECRAKLLLDLKEEGETQSQQQEQQDQVDSECALYLAPSSIPGAGLGIYTAVDLPNGSPVGDMDELFIPIIDKFKTLPYRGQQKFLSWLAYVWPDQPFAFDFSTQNDRPFPPIPLSKFDRKEGLNAADGLEFYDGKHRVSVFAPGIASLANSHMQHANLIKTTSVDDESEDENDKLSSHRHNKDWAGLTLGEDIGVGAFTPHHGVGFTASKDIPAGSELLINYGKGWHDREELKEETKDEDFLTLEDYHETRLNNISLPDEETIRDQREDNLEYQEELREKVEALIKERAEAATRIADDEAILQVPRELDETTNEEENEVENEENEGVEEEDDGEKKRLHVIFSPGPNGELDTSKMAAVDVYPDDDMETLILLLHRLEIPRTFWGVPRVKLEGYAVVMETLGVSDKRLIFEPITADEALGDNVAEEGFVIVLIPDEDAIAELIKSPESDEDEDDSDDESDTEATKGNESSESFAKSVAWLKENGMCIDNLRIGPSTVEQAGRGSFAKRTLSKGDLIAPAPLLALKREDLVIYAANDEETNFRDVLDFNNVVGQELLLNYCYGHPESPLLLLPYSPVVSAINHNSQEPNAIIRWSDNAKDWLDSHPLEVLEMSGDLMMQVVALRDIMPGEEIFIDYGRDWEDSWKVYEEEQQEEYDEYEIVHGSFRHEIGVPEGFFPDSWKNKSVEYEVAYPDTPLKPGEVAPVVWAHNGQPVSKTAWMVGLPQGLSDHMLEYSNDMGITQMYETLLEDGPLDSNEWFVFNSTKGDQWFAQQYQAKAWRFNIHYIAAWDEAARVSFLRALGQGGYDVVLDGLGRHFKYDNMTCFHLSYMGVTECDQSKMHADVYATGDVGLNIIFPLITVDGSKPELDVQSDNANIVSTVKYKKDLAYVMTDYGYHKTSPIQYEGRGQMRMVVGLYCAELGERNAEMGRFIYDGEHPAPFYGQFDLPLGDPHWGNGHSLPK